MTTQVAYSSNLESEIQLIEKIQRHHDCCKTISQGLYSPMPDKFKVLRERLYQEIWEMESKLDLCTANQEN